MDKLIKLLRKISKQDRQMIKSLLVLIKNKQFVGLDIAKIKSTVYYRARKGRFRIIFYFNQNNQVMIYDIRTRNEKTYTFRNFKK